MGSLQRLGLPHGAAAKTAAQFLKSGVKVIDLSADFRLQDLAEWERWYKMKHTEPQLVREAVYGLCELNREKIRGARLVANPGCYPTSIQLGLLPLVEAGVVDIEHLIADAKSGVSGAGRKPTLKTSFCEVTENFSAYSILQHRHVPEVLLTSGLEEGEFSFTAQLIPIDRGILETIYFRTARPTTAGTVRL